MGLRVEELIARQEVTFLEIKQLCVNYKKDSADRKTLEYLEKRLALINASWEQFAQNNVILEAGDKTDHQYFTDSVFNKTKVMYEDVVTDITNRRSELLLKTTSGTPQTPALQAGSSRTTTTAAKSDKSKFNFDFGDITFQVPPPKTKENAEKQQDLLRQQFCNFRAFESMVKKLDLDFMAEKWELEDNLNIIKNKWGHIEKIHWELDYILQDDENNYKLKYMAMENVYDNLRKQLNHKIWNNSHYEKATPKIVIPDFYGNYNQWTTLKDLYVESVHNNPLLSNAQKMQHLKTKLKGEAEKLVQHLGISAENYISCWDIISHRYDNKRLLFISYMNTLLNQPTMQQANAITIKKLHDAMLEGLNGLNNIGLDISTWDPIIVYLLTQKLDSETYSEYMKELKEPRNVPNLEEFMNFLENKFMALETLQGRNNQKTSQSYKQQPQNKPTYANNFQSSRNNYKYKSNNNTTRASYFGKSQTMPNAFAMTARKCPLCKTDHVLIQCNKFLNMNAAGRHDAVRNLRLCKNCLYSHGEQQCTSEKRCKLCNKHHHTLMHESETSRQINNPTPTSSSHVVNNITNEEKEVLLTTVLLKVKNCDGDFINLRGLLDQGSQVSLITEDAAQRLRLPRQRGSAVVSGVGALSGSCKGSLRLECKSIHTDYQFQMETLIMKKLINNLPTSSFSINDWQYLENLKLADPQFNMSSPVDLLLGAC